MKGRFLCFEPGAISCALFANEAFRILPPEFPLMANMQFFPNKWKILPLAPLFRKKIVAPGQPNQLYGLYPQFFLRITPSKFRTNFQNSQNHIWSLVVIKAIIAHIVVFRILIKTRICPLIIYDVFIPTHNQCLNIIGIIAR